MPNTKQSHPINHDDLYLWRSTADQRLQDIGGRNIQDVFVTISEDQQTWLLADELRLILISQRAVCLYYYFVKLLSERMDFEATVQKFKAGQTELMTEIKRKKIFIAGYAFFAMSASIVLACNKILRGKDESKLSRFEMSDVSEISLGLGFDRDLTQSLESYLRAVESTSPTGGNLVKTDSDLVSVTRDFWKGLGDRIIKVLETMKEFLPLVEGITFHHGQFVLTGLAAEYKSEAKTLTWRAVTEAELIGDPDITRFMKRQCQRLALFDPIIGKNPVCVLGGLMPSILMDGRPGSGKSTRAAFMITESNRLAEMGGLPCRHYSVTADSVKNEFYGKTAQLLTQIFGMVLDLSSISVLLIDDIDLLLSGDRDAAGTNGADKDIMSGFMQFFSGVGSKNEGNCISLAATNQPTGLDPALRQRFAYGVFIEGPKSCSEYADLVAQETRGLGQHGLLKVATGKYKPFSQLHRSSIIENMTRAFKTTDSGGNWDDIGILCERLHQEDPTFTGRPIKNAIQTARAKASDFDIPIEWFEKPDVFRNKPWDERINMLRELYQPLTAEQIITAIKQQFEREQRYRREAEEKKVADTVERFRIEQLAIERFRGKK